MMRAKMSSFFNSTSAPQPLPKQQQDDAPGEAGVTRPAPSPATVTTAADEDEAASVGASVGGGTRSSDVAAALGAVAGWPTPSSAGSASGSRQVKRAVMGAPATAAATPNGSSNGSTTSFFFSRPSLSLPGTPRILGGGGGRASPSPTGRPAVTPSAATAGRLQWLQPPWQSTTTTTTTTTSPPPPATPEEAKPLLVFYVKLSNLVCHWEAPQPVAAPSNSSGVASTGGAAGAPPPLLSLPPPSSLRRNISAYTDDGADQINEKDKDKDREKLPRSPSTPTFASSVAAHAGVPGREPGPAMSAGSAPPSVQCSPARHQSLFNSAGGGNVLMLDASSSAAASAAPAVSRLAVLFPLPSENRLETASRTLEYLDATICHEWTTWSRERKGLLKSTTHHPWAQAATSEGVTISAAVKVGGSLHMLLKLADPNGQEIAQAVVPLPKPGHGRRTTSSGSVGEGVGPRRAQQQGVRAALTLHTAYRGTLTCDVEIVKVRRKGGRMRRRWLLVLRPRAGVD